MALDKVIKELKLNGNILYKSKQACVYADDIALIARNVSITTGDASNNKKDWNEIRFEYKQGQDKIHENGTKTREYKTNNKY